MEDLLVRVFQTKFCRNEDGNVDFKTLLGWIVRLVLAVAVVKLFDLLTTII